MPYSANFKEKTGSTSGEEPVYLLEISHAALAVPVRVVRDTQDLVSNGNTFIALAFEIQLPSDIEGRLPRVPIRIDNIGRELTQWLDASNGGQGATARVMQVMRDDPDTLEYDVTLDLLNVKQNGAFVTGELGYENTLALPALVASYRPDNTPAIF
jgi:hypothetical protein